MRYADVTTEVLCWGVGCGGGEGEIFGQGLEEDFANGIGVQPVCADFKAAEARSVQCTDIVGRDAM